MYTVIPISLLKVHGTIVRTTFDRPSTKSYFNSLFDHTLSKDYNQFIKYHVLVYKISSTSSYNTVKRFVSKITRIVCLLVGFI